MTAKFSLMGTRVLSIYHRLAGLRQDRNSLSRLKCKIEIGVRPAILQFSGCKSHQPEQYAYSSHRAYLGLESAGIVDVDPVLRHFGAKKRVAREAYREFVTAGMKLGHQPEFYRADEACILGSEEFIDATIHRLGQANRSGHLKREREQSLPSVDAEALLKAVETLCGLNREKFCGPGKCGRLVRAKEALILVGARVGASNAMMSALVKLNSSTVSRRLSSAADRLSQPGRRRLIDQIEKYYWQTRS